MHSNLIPGAILLLSLSCASDPGSGMPPPDVVPQVDLSRYLGTWYEIASFPQRFQRGCENTKAVYSLRADGTIEVLNSCFRNGKTDVAKGKAWVADKTTNAKLKVSFFWPFRGDYWIIELGNDYEYAVVAGPGRNYLWILARSSTMDKGLYDAIVGRLKEQGFDITKLRLTERRIRS
ncbi:MAG TPA: lipocalin family protein [Nitrospirota bacterium]|nr:lipocalin family protein [Nitrospirota bacterium]